MRLTNAVARSFRPTTPSDNLDFVSASAAELVGRYQAAMAKHDVARGRSLLADDLHFKGPLDEFHRADEYIAALERLAKITTAVENAKMFASGDEVALFYDLVTNTPAGTSAVAELYRVARGKIVEIRAIFDARPFAAMFAARG